MKPKITMGINRFDGARSGQKHWPSAKGLAAVSTAKKSKANVWPASRLPDVVHAVGFFWVGSAKKQTRFS